MRHAALRQIVILLHRNFFRHSEVKPKKITPQYSLAQVVISFINTNMHKQPRLDTLSRELGYSETRSEL